METPLVFFIFNRPEHTKKVFEAIRRAKPKQLFVVADGPRDSRDRTEETRAIIQVDWPCQVEKNYSDKNLGCKQRISSGLDWVFSKVETAIILEDDCLPDQSFFRFCEEMLIKYRDDAQVMHIGGNFFQQKNKGFRTESSYYFSKIPHIWGWATWKRAWKNYDVSLSKWPETKANSSLIPRFKNAGAYEYWSKVWDEYYSHKIDSWDGQWFFACMYTNGYCITPTKNLVTNIGFGIDATHTKKTNDTALVPAEPIDFPLSHSPKVIMDAYDNFTFRNNFGIDKKLKYRLLRPFKNSFPKKYATLKNISLRVRAFKNWYRFVWPLNRLWPTHLIHLRNGTDILIRDIHSSDFSIAVELGQDDYYPIPSDVHPSVIVDAGANIGIFSIIMAQRFPHATIHAIEPEESNVDQMRKNIALNNIKNITVHRALLSGTPGTGTLYMSHFSSAHSTRHIAGAEKQTVPHITLSEIGNIDILKIDIEGGEYDVFKQNIPDIPYIIMEVHPTENESEISLIEKFKPHYSIVNKSPVYLLRRK